MRGKEVLATFRERMCKLFSEGRVEGQLRGEEALVTIGGRGVVSLGRVRGEEILATFGEKGGKGLGSGQG